MRVAGSSWVAEMTNSAESIAVSDEVFEESVQALIKQVQTMVRESGDPHGFDAEKCVRQWIDWPIPALGGKTPSSYMVTVEGQRLVSNLLARSQSGAYS